MTENAKRKVAVKFRSLIDNGSLRKNAIEYLRERFNVSRRSVYRYCKRFGISTK